MMKTLVITANDAIVDRIISLFDLFPKEQYEMTVTSRKTERKTPQPLSIKRGAGKSFITYIAEDFDEPLADFQEYSS